MKYFSIIFAILLLIILIPLFLLIGFLVKLTSKGPILHWSKRIGKNNILFLMPKIRTMEVGTPQLATHEMQNERNYLTPSGKFLRKTSLDELPQVWSIIKGDMAFVGPRPALFSQNDLINLRTKNKIHHLKPGITGWAQINGRDEISIEKKLELEVFYMKNKSTLLDFKILCHTFISVLLKKNISH
jgi:O-antigen biosynthesis protein WbqP